jgi:hypothetical protein
MQKHKRNKTTLLILVLLSVVAALMWQGLSAKAAGSSGISTLKVTAAYTDGEKLLLDITDSATGEVTKAELPLTVITDNTADEYITLQVSDADGNVSGSVVIKNPAKALSELNNSMPIKSEGIDGGEVTPSPVDTDPPEPEPGEEGIPFTPDGTGSVIDNAADGDGKEFFTIQAKDEKVFYLIVDRQRDTDNVYFLDTVTINDLASLADGGITVATPTPDLSLPGVEQSAPEPTANPLTEQSPLGGKSAIFIGIGVIAVVAAGWYFKIYKPNHSAGYDDDDYPDDDNNNNEEDDEI